MKTKARIAGALLATVAGVVAMAGSARGLDTRAVDVIQVKGVIDPPAARYLEDRLTAASRAGVEAAIVEIDTAGGLQVSNQEIADAVLDSRVPVVAWVAPRGAQAASTGAVVVYAANIALISDSGTLGPAGPPSLGPSSAEQSAGLESLFERLSQARGRGPGSAPPPVVGDGPVSAQEAVGGSYVDGTASSLRDVLQVIDGQRVVMDDGDVRTLETWDEGAGAPSVTIRFAQMNVLQRILHAVTSPEVALLLFLAGIFGIVFELYNPGIGLAAIVGLVALALGVYALTILPTGWAGILVVTAGIGLLLADLHTSALGGPSIAGLAAVGLGAALAFRGADPALSLSPWAIVAAIVATLLFFISVMTAALRVRLRRPVEGEGIVGTVGEAKTDIAPEGTVLTNGTLWRARTMETGIAAGQKVEVKATEGLVLLVEPLHEPHAADAPVE